MLLVNFYSFSMMFKVTEWQLDDSLKFSPIVNVTSVTKTLPSHLQTIEVLDSS